MIRRNYGFSVEVRHALPGSADDCDETMLIVEGDMTPFHPGSNNPDSPRFGPDELPEIQDIKVTVKNGRPIWNEELDALTDDESFMEKVYEKLAAQEASDKEDAAERRWEARNDR